MKLIIDIDESLLDGIKTDNFDFTKKVVKNFQGTIANTILHGTPIPDNATNGNVVKTLFSNTFDNFCERTTWEWNRWWNTPYQKGGK